MSFIALAFAIYLAARFFDRLRKINWHTVRAPYVGLYLSGLLWNLGVMQAVFVDGITWHQLAGLAALFCLLEINKHTWAEGVPDAAKTVPADLGSAELGHGQ